MDSVISNEKKQDLPQVPHDLVRDARGTWIFAAMAFFCILNNLWTVQTSLWDLTSARAWLTVNQPALMVCDILSSILMLLMIIEPVEPGKMMTLTASIFMLHGVDYGFAAWALAQKDSASAMAFAMAGAIQELLAVALFAGYGYELSSILPFQTISDRAKYARLVQV